MASFNKVILLGNLTRDPEVRVTPSGVSVCKFGMAVSRNTRTADGGPREETLFVDVDAFGKQAELIGKHMTKGRAILVEGRLRLDQWESSNGEKRNKIMVVLENFQFIGSWVDSDPNTAANSGESVAFAENLTRVPKAPASATMSTVDIDEDIPF